MRRIWLQRFTMEEDEDNGLTVYGGCDDEEETGSPEHEANEEEQPLTCPGCRRKSIVGAADVYNARQRITQALDIQAKFIEKHRLKDGEKASRTWETRQALYEFWQNTMADFDQQFAGQIVPGPSCDKRKKRKRNKI